MASQRDPGGHCGTRQRRRLLERQVARHRHGGFFIDDRVLRQHAVQIGAEPVRQVIRLDRPAKPARVKAGNDPVADHEPVRASAEPDDFAGAVAERHDPEPGRAPAAAFEHHQVAIIERRRTHPDQDFPGSGLRIVA